MTYEDIQGKILLRYAPINLPLQNLYVKALNRSQYICDRLSSRGSISHKDLSNLLVSSVVPPGSLPPHNYHLRPRNRNRYHPYHHSDHQNRRPQRILKGAHQHITQTQVPLQLPEVPRVSKTAFARLFIARDTNVDGHLDKKELRRLLEDLDKEYWAREVWVVACKLVEKEIDDYLKKFGILPVPSGDLIDGNRGAKYMAASGADGAADGKRWRGDRYKSDDVFDESCRWSGSKEVLGRFVATFMDRCLPEFELKHRVEALGLDHTTIFTFEMAMNIVKAHSGYINF